ncbi:MAG: hypothetical protein EPO02_07975 [Nitrospirae bacterium]|nr:MAG: hypothetical protein EPO02_07975 [Nitrospirota bacterium]
MKIHGVESGGVLIGALLVGLLLAMLGGVAMNLAVNETAASARHVEERNGLLLAESGVEQVVAWLTHGDLPLPGGAPTPDRCAGTADRPAVELDAVRPDDDRALNGMGAAEFRALADLGRIVRTRLYEPGLPDGFCTVEVTAESKNGVRRTVVLELGALRVPPLHAAVQYAVLPAGAGNAESHPAPAVLAYWGEIQAQVPGLPPSPWHYQAFKDHARRFGAYYVPDREGRLYKDETMDPSAALTPAEVFGAKAAGDQRGLVFIDTLDRQPPAETNLATLVLDSAYMEGVFYVNAHVVLRPEGRGETIPALSPPTETAPGFVSRVPVNLMGMAIRGVLHVSGTIRVDGPSRVFGAVVAERGLAGAGLLEVWYDHDLGRGLVRGLPVVFPLRGSWREW